MPFLRSLAQGLVERLGEELPRALIFLPTRRAVRALGDEFVAYAAAQKNGVAILPRMRPLADIDPEEPPFEPGELVGLISPALPTAQRRFDMAQILARYHSRISELPLSVGGSLGLADQLLSVMDDAAMDEIEFIKSDKIEDMRAQAAEHYQNAATLFEIVSEHWPAYLAAQNMMEPMARRVALLNALTDHWTERPPDYPIIIAGSTGSLKATARLMRCVARLPKSAIILPGLDKNLRDSVWATVEDQHPQNALKALIETIGVSRDDVQDWSYVSGGQSVRARQRILSEALVPAKSADDWPSRIATVRAENPGDTFERAFDGLSLIEAQNDEEEALGIALILREAIEEDGQTAALVTPDPALARRVKAKLRRWQIEVDYSQGEPLEETQLGAYLAGLLRLSLDPENPVDLAFIAKHPLTRVEGDNGQLKADWERLERDVLRGPRLSFERMAQKFARGDKGFKAPELKAAFKRVQSFVDDVRQLSEIDRALPEQWARALTELAQALSQTENDSPPDSLWQGDAGEKASQIISSLIAHGESLGEMDVRDFADLLSTLMRGKVVRPRFGMDPRLRILGPLEARMIEVDTLVLGGLNEGVWPAAPAVEPFLSYGMRKELGLSLPEKRFGLQAHDFAELACHPKVILTRSERSESGPTVASRWLWRLKTLAKGALGERADAALAPPNPYLEWARALDAVEAKDVTPVEPPEFSPPEYARWPKPKGRELAVTRLTTLVRDPYAHYARYILGLRSLDPLDAPIGPRELGNIVHDSLEDFAKEYGNKIDGTSQARLVEMFEEKLRLLGIVPAQIRAEQGRLNTMAQKFCDWCQVSFKEGWDPVGLEITGELIIKSEDNPFRFIAKSDRIDQRGTGYRIVDYKTGAPPSDNVVKAGFDLQLPLQAAMIEAGGFKDIKAETASGEVEDMLYLSLRGHTQDTPQHSIVKKDYTVERFVDQATETLEKLVAYFDAPDAVYHAQPRIQFSNDYGDYDQLSRRAEWAKAGDNDGGVPE